MRSFVSFGPLSSGAYSWFEDERVWWLSYGLGREPGTSSSGFKYRVCEIMGLGGGPDGVSRSDSALQLRGRRSPAFVSSCHVNIALFGDSEKQAAKAEVVSWTVDVGPPTIGAVRAGGWSAGARLL